MNYARMNGADAYYAARAYSGAQAVPRSRRFPGAHAYSENPYQTTVALPHPSARVQRSRCMQVMLGVYLLILVISVCALWWWCGSLFGEIARSRRVSVDAIVARARAGRAQMQNAVGAVAALAQNVRALPQELLDRGRA